MKPATWLSRLYLMIFVGLSSALFGLSTTVAQKQVRVEPPFWWAGMHESQLQLLVYGENIAQSKVQLDYPGVSLIGITRVDNPNYLFIDLALKPDIQHGKFTLNFLIDKKLKYHYTYELRQREPESAFRKGFDQSDVLYLLMPDRFANGNPLNDNHPEMIEKANRLNPSGRHGGDIQGINDHLDYFNELGVTTLWINPLLENNHPEFSYHGYAITDFYRIDPRFGSNADYVDLVDAAHKKGLKIVMDMILNHCGINHWFIKDLPMPGWIHQFPEFTRSNFRAETLTDPHAAKSDQNRMLQGWFDKHMPDLDQRNPYLRNYLIQNSIWWIEYANLDGIRLDTQPYPYAEMTSEWTARILNEYPGFNIVGESWLQREAMTAYFQKQSSPCAYFNSGMPVVTDFPLQGAVSRAFTEQEGWSEGMARIYMVLAQDFVYDNPYNTLIFLDNHDLNRYFNTIGNDLDALKMALTFLFTTRGIPQLYYGTELLMDGQEHLGHGDIRKDFPGGWKEDSLNAFTASGRSEAQNEVFNHLQQLLLWRKTNRAVHYGRLLHFLPENGVYTYFRILDKEVVMVMINNSKEKGDIDINRFSEITSGFIQANDVMSGEAVLLKNNVALSPRSARIFELK
ncbi:MAG: glycoside hydrolase family 13 protein [Lentimicrobiaceae bacterium]|nr:glycoside hydrolase family 13 protein [Lentimicrobiaceae bacterium]